MITKMKSRPYKQKQRAEQANETRERIVVAAMELHGEIGPRQSSIKAIAERAGVQRLTVYRHFADETELFHACSSHWLAQNPPPDSAAWLELGSEQRIESALNAYCVYYQRTAYMWEKIYRDLSLTEALLEPMAAFHRFLNQQCKQVLADNKKPMCLRTLYHCLLFPSWQSLQQQGIKNPGKVELYLAWLRGSASA